MNVDLSKPWREVFAAVAEVKAEEKRRRQLDALTEQLDRQDWDKQTKERREEKKKEDDQAFALVLASSERIAEFTNQLDELDTANVEALMKNREALDRVQAQIHQMLDQAARLPDGRHVFKTEDGTRVFDENGVELSHDVVDPHSIDDRLPRWQAFDAFKKGEAGLEAERHERLTYQTRLDDARDRAAKGGMTNGELDALKSDLQATMPKPMRDEVEHGSGKPDAPQHHAAGVAPTALDLDEALRVSPNRSIPAPALIP